MTQGDLFETQERELQIDETFDLPEAQVQKEDGMQAAAESEKRRLALDCAREAVEDAALGRGSQTATIDDAYEALLRAGFPESILGNAAGSVFRGLKWKWTGQMVPSKRVSNHGRIVRVWRIKHW